MYIPVCFQKFSPCKLFGTKQISQFFFDFLEFPCNWDYQLFLSSFLKSKLIRGWKMREMILRLNENGTKQNEWSRFQNMEIVPDLEGFVWIFPKWKVRKRYFSYINPKFSAKIILPNGSCYVSSSSQLLFRLQKKIS